MIKLLKWFHMIMLKIFLDCLEYDELSALMDGVKRKPFGFRILRFSKSPTLLVSDGALL